MAILFILAVLFAIPTYGLSLLAWVVLALMRGKSRADRVVERDNRKVFIEPLFTGQFAEFFHALDMPFYVGETIDHDDAHKCGRHIMNYIAHNPVEGKVFMQGLNKWRTKGDYSPCHPVVAANDERTLGRVDKRDSQARLLLIQDCFLRSSHGSRGFVGCGVGTDRATAAA